MIVITGATGILGSSMVEHFAEQGAKVVIIGRNREAGERLEKAAREQGGEAMFLECDVLNKAMLEQCYEQIMAAYGRIDVLINGAGGNQAAATVPPDKTIFDLDAIDPHLELLAFRSVRQSISVVFSHRVCGSL